MRTHALSDLEKAEKVCMKWAATDSSVIEPAEMARMLSDFYNAIEEACVRIVEQTEGPVDRTQPGWGDDLMERLSADVPDKRPALLTRALKRHLAQFRNLRDYLRETPGVTPAADMLKALICSTEATLTQFRASVLRFLERVS
jgi:hypothetical protein